MQCFSCVNCSWNSKMHPDSSSSIIHVSSGHSLKCRFSHPGILIFPPLLLWCIDLWSLLFSGSIQLSSHRSSATIAHWSVISIKYTFSEFVVSFRLCNAFFLCPSFMKSIFDCTLSQRILTLRWISSGLLSSFGVLCCVSNVLSISECWLSLVLLLVSSFRAVSPSMCRFLLVLASWLYFCWDLELSACSLARFLRSCVSKVDHTLLLMCWLTNLGVPSWSTWLLQRPVFWFDWFFYLCHGFVACCWIKWLLLIPVKLIFLKICP